MSELIKRWPKASFLILSVLAVTLAFFDVVFQHASLSMLDQYNPSGQPRQIHTLLPERPDIAPYEGYYDAGGGALQSEPAIQFMKHSIYNFESPFWNPFSGAGSFGPETMVDIKFSPLSLAVAVLGGSNSSFHFVTLLFYSLAVFFLYRVLVEYLSFSYQTGIAAGFVYLLNGYFTANISSNTSQCYLYFPFALFSVLQFSRRPTTLNYYCLVCSYVLPLLVTFFPTTILMLACVSTAAVGASLYYKQTWRKRFLCVGMHATAPVVAGLILAFLYIPLAEALRYVSAVQTYSLREFVPANWQALVSFMTPKHFFLSYNAINPDFLPFINNTIFHFGIIPCLVGSLLIFSGRAGKDPLFLSFAGLFGLAMGRIFSVPVISQLVDVVPFFRNLGEQYWWMMVGCSFPVIFAYGFERLRAGRVKIWPVLLVLATMLSQLAHIGLKFGLPIEQQKYSGVHTPGAHIAVAMAIAITCAGLIWQICRSARRKDFLLWLLVVCVFCELMYDMDTARFRRTEMFAEPTPDIAFLKSHIGPYRVANYGSGGFPPESGQAFQIPQVESFTMNILPKYYDICQRDLTTEHGWFGKDTFCLNRDTPSEPNINETMLNLLGVKYVVVTDSMSRFKKFFEDRKFPHVFAMPNVSIYENPSVFPRAFVVTNLYESPLTPETKGQSGRNVAFSDDEILIKDAISKGIPVGMPANDGEASELFSRAKISNYENAKVTIEVNLNAPGVLVLMDNWHPGWSAVADGSVAHLGRVNESFRGVALSSGRHIVEMTYRPITLKLALGITVASLFLLILGAFFRNTLDRKIFNLANSEGTTRP